MAAVNTPSSAAATSPNYYEPPSRPSSRPTSASRQSPVRIPDLDHAEGPRLRDGPVSPVRVNFQQGDWVQPSNADVEYTPKQALRGIGRPYSSSASLTPRDFSSSTTPTARS
ncbi:hypothetical protein NXS19_001580 [Fusarium pseudograminearum]|nr:hypothetical protein NXS19_001580 [Fusarium pseudograminearum]